MSARSDDPYNARVRDLFQRTPGAGRLDGEGVSSGRAGGPQHGAEVVLWLRTERGTICEARYQVLGCPHTIAAAALLVEQLTRKDLSEARMDVSATAEVLAVPVEKLGRLLLVEDALLAALTAAGAPDQAPDRDVDSVE